MAAEMTYYPSHVRDPVHGYQSVGFPDSDGLEISCRVLRHPCGRSRR